MSPEDIEQANQTQMLLEQGKAEAAQAGAELRQDQRKNKALETGRQAMEDLLNLVGTANKNKNRDCHYVTSCKASSIEYTRTIWRPC